MCAFSPKYEPVADGGPDGHSIFAYAVLQALDHQMEGLFTASSLFYERVLRAVAGNSEQIPVYQPIRNSGDIGGDFVFRRVAATGAEVRERLSAAAAGFNRGEALYRSADFEGAASAFRVSCMQDDARACAELGSLYEMGRGVKKDFTQAVALLRKGCDGVDAVGCSNLGILYENGSGVARDNAQAVTLFRNACDGGNASGCFNLGLMYANGSGVTQNDAQAIALYRKGCDGGDTFGCNALGLIYESGSGVTQDNAQAVAFYRKACDGGDAGGCFYLKRIQGLRPQ